MEWLLLVMLALVAALIVAPPLWTAGEQLADDGVDLAAERARLVAELRELDEDAEAGRISRQDRLEGRRALAPRLRAVTERLREEGRA